MENVEIDTTKSRILKVALDLFANEGFDSVSTRKIAQLANCNIAALNYHFGTKKQLYNECLMIMEPKTEYQMEQFLKPPETKEDFEESFLRFCELAAAFIAENDSSIKLLINEINSDRDQSVKDTFLKPLSDVFVSYLRKAQANGIVNSNIEVILVTKMVIAVIVSQKLYKSFQSFEHISNKDLARKIVQTWTSSFYV